MEAYAACGLIGKAAKAADCDRSSHGYWIESDPAYPERFQAAQDAANEVLEAEARRRAVDGMERMKFYKGEPILDPRTGEPYIEHEYSDRLLELALKAHLPEKYVDRTENVNVNSELPEATAAMMGDPDVRKAMLAAERKYEDARTPKK